MRPKSSRNVPKNQEDWAAHLQALTDDVHDALSQNQITLADNLPMEFRKINVTSGRTTIITGQKSLNGLHLIETSSPVTSQFIKVRPDGKVELTIESSEINVTVGLILIYKEGLTNV